MRVSEILLNKGSETVTIRPDDSIAHAVELLRDHGYGALVVSTDEARIEGIVSERDIVRALGFREDLLDLEVAAIMTADVVTCGPDDRTDELMTMMTERRVRHLPVEIDGELSGVISIGDVVKARVAELELEAEAMAQYIHHGR